MDINTMDGTVPITHALSFGVVVLDKHLTPLFCNQAAEQILGSKNGLRVARAGLRPHSDAKFKQFQRLVTQLLSQPVVTASTTRQHTASDEGFFTVKKLDGKQHYKLMLTAIANHAGTKIPEAHVLLFIFDSASDSPLSVELLQRCFGLTPAEARVALAIADGKSLAQCADLLEHSIHTSRNLLKRVYSKTNTRRQNELVRLLFQSVLPFPVSQSS